MHKIEKNKKKIGNRDEKVRYGENHIRTVQSAILRNK